MIQEEHPPAAKLTLRWMGQIILLKEEDITLLLSMVKQVIDRLQNWTCLFVIIGFFRRLSVEQRQALGMSRMGSHDMERFV